MCNCEKESSSISSYVQDNELVLVDNCSGVQLGVEIKFCPFCGERVKEEKKDGMD